MLYIVKLDKLELNIVKDALLKQYEKEKDRKRTCLMTNNHVDADLAEDMMGRVIKTLGKFESITALAED